MQIGAGRQMAFYPRRDALIYFFFETSAETLFSLGLKYYHNQLLP